LNQLTVISALIFVAALLAVEAIYLILFRSRQASKAINRRLALSKRLATPNEVLSALRSERGLSDLDTPLFRRINDWLAQTGLRFDRRRVLLFAAGLTALLFMALSAAVGFGLLALALAILFAIVLIGLFFRAVRQRRIARFAELLPDGIDVIVRGLRVGYPLPAAFDLVAREMPDPIGSEFGMTSDEISFGQDLRTAIENLYRRVGQEDLLFVLMAINVQSQTGGNLAEILTGLSRLLRNRSKLHLKIRALSADGRMSAIVLSLIPFVLFGGILLISPSYFGEVRDHPFVVPALIYAAISLGLGNLIMYRMVNFKF
jgi:tight adherence protein B